MGEDQKYRLRPAVPPGMPVRDYLDQAGRAHQALVSGRVSQAERLFAPEIVTDLTDLLRAGIGPRARPEVHPDLAVLEHRKSQCAIVDHQLWPAVRDQLLQVKGSLRMVLLHCRDGVSLEQDGHGEMLREAAGFGLVKGVNWAGRQPATNAVRMAKLTGRAWQMTGASHLKVAQQRVGCTVAPVGPGGREGFLNLVCPAREVNPEMLALVSRIAQDTAVEIEARSRARLQPLRRWAQARLDPQRYVGGALVIDGKGRVAGAWRQDHENRVQPPEGGFRIGCHEVDGLGQVVFEPSPGGGLAHAAADPRRGSPCGTGGPGPADLRPGQRSRWPDPGQRPDRILGGGAYPGGRRDSADPGGAGRAHL